MTEILNANSDEPMVEELVEKVSAPAPAAASAASSAAAPEAAPVQPNTFVVKQLSRAAEFSCTMEHNRGTALSALASKLLLTIALLMVALFSSLSVVGRFFYEQGLAVHMFIFYAVVFAVLIGAFATVISSQLRFRHPSYASPKSLAEYMRSAPESETPAETAQNYCNSLELTYLSVRGRNDNMQKQLSSALILLLVASGLAVAFTAALAVLGFLSM